MENIIKKWIKNNEITIGKPFKVYYVNETDSLHIGDFFISDDEGYLLYEVDNFYPKCKTFIDLLSGVFKIELK